MNKRIDEMFAYVAVGDEGEGVMSMSVGDKWLPLVGADMERMKSLYHAAQAISEYSKRPFRLIKFSDREDITETIKKEMGK